MALARGSYVFNSASLDIFKSCIHIFVHHKQVRFWFSISLLIVKRHWAKWKWRYINFVIIIISIIIIIISVINNADYRACSQTFYFLCRISTFSRRRCVVVGNILGWVN